MKTAAGEYDDNHEGNHPMGTEGGSPWGQVVNYITTPGANVPPNKAAGAHTRWSQSLHDNGAVRSSFQTASQFGAQDMFQGGMGSAQFQDQEHVGDQDSGYGEDMHSGSQH